jgi:hypothetical protein
VLGYRITGDARMINEIHTRRCRLSRRAVALLLGAISVFSLEIGSARSADLPLQPPPPRQYSETREYYEEQLPAPREDYVYRRRPAPYYSEPPMAYYEYAPAPPAVVIEEEPYYWPPRYSYSYRYWGHGPYVARGYGHHGGGGWGRGYHRW